MAVPNTKEALSRLKNIEGLIAMGGFISEAIRSAFKDVWRRRIPALIAEVYGDGVISEEKGYTLYKTIANSVESFVEGYDPESDGEGLSEMLYDLIMDHLEVNTSEEETGEKGKGKERTRNSNSMGGDKKW